MHQLSNVLKQFEYSYLAAENHKIPAKVWVYVFQLHDGNGGGAVQAPTPCHLSS